MLVTFDHLWKKSISLQAVKISLKVLVLNLQSGVLFARKVVEKPYGKEKFTILLNKCMRKWKSNINEL